MGILLTAQLQLCIICSIINTPSGAPMQSYARPEKDRPEFMDDAYALFKNAEYDKAVVAFTNLRMHPRYQSFTLDVELGIARCYQGKKMYKEAVSIMRRLNPPEAHLRDRQNLQLALHFCYTEMRDFVNARTALEKAPMQNYPKTVLAWISFYIKVSDIENAQKKVDYFTTLSNDPKYSRRFNDGKFDKDYRKFSLILSNNDNTDDICEVSIHDYPHIIRLKAIHKIIPLLSDMDEEEYAEKVRHIQTVLAEITAKAPKLDYIYMIRADLLRKQNKMELAITELERLLANSPQNYSCMMKLGLFLHIEGRQQEAREYLLKVITASQDKRLLLKPTNLLLAKTYNCIALTFLDDRKNLRQVLEYGEAGIKADPAYAPTYSTLGKYWRYVNNEKNATRYFDKAMELNQSRFNRLHPVKKENESNVQLVKANPVRQVSELTPPPAPVSKTISIPAPIKTRSRKTETVHVEKKVNPFDGLSESIEDSELSMPVPKPRYSKAKITSKPIVNNSAVKAPSVNTSELKPPVAETETPVILPGLDDYILPGHIGGAVKNLIRWGYSFFQPAQSERSEKESRMRFKF